MPIVDEDAFGGRPLARVFLAVTVSEARRVEAVLDQHGIDYCVRVEPCGRTLFGSTRQGAAFFVDDARADFSDEMLVQAGLSAGIVRDEPSADATGKPDAETGKL